MNRLGLVWTILLASAAVFAAACPSPDHTATPYAPQYPLEFTTIEQSPGHMPYYYDMAPRLLVIASSKEAQTDVPMYLYSDLQNADNPGDTVTQIRQTDYSRYVVVAAFQGYGGAGIQLHGVWREQNSVVIEGRLDQGPPERTLGQSPYQVLRIGKQSIPQETTFVLRDQYGEELATAVVSTAWIQPTPSPALSGTLMSPAPSDRSKPDALYPGYVDISLVPDRYIVRIGEKVLVRIMVDTDDKPVGSLRAFLEFNPDETEVTDVTPGETMSVTLTRQYDNSKGQVDYSASASLGDVASGNFVLATIEFKVKAARTHMPLIIVAAPPRGPTDATFEGASVLRSAVGVAIGVP